jgi:putative phosphoesterase
LTSITILKVFKNKEVHAVHGNMCDLATEKILPRKKTVRVGNFTIGIIHRPATPYNLENALLDEFDGVDCIVFGHTHQPVCKKSGGVLFINPGSFMPTGRYGAPGTYALLEVDTELRGRLAEVPY